jgi:hypothetical protein
MANDVTINVKANTAQAQTGLKGLANSLNNTVTGLTGMNLSMLAGVGGVVMLGNAVKKQISQWQDYALKSKDAAASVGMNVEQFSRLVQVADDVRLSQETLTTALQMMAKNGVEPSIDNLAKLADEVKGLSVTERAARLSTLFGRSWKEVYKILADGGDALKANTAAVAEGMVVTQRAAIEAHKLFKAQDDLNDATTAVANTWTKTVVPSLSNFINHYMEYLRLLQSGKNLLEVERWSLIQQELWTNINSKASQTYGDRLTGLALSMGYVISENGDLVLATQNAGNAAATATPQVRGLEQAYKDVYSAQDSLQQATADFGVEVGTNLQSKFEQAGIKGDELNTVLGYIDESLGTSLQPAQRLKDMQQELADAYINGGRDGEAFKKKLEEMKGPMEDLYQPIVDARVQLETLESVLIRMSNTQYTIAVSMGAPIPIPSFPSGGGGGGGGTVSTGGGSIPPGLPGGPGGANGLDFIVPPGFANDSFPFRAQSGERVQVTPANQTNMGGITIIINGAGSPQATANAVANRLAKYGKQYQG